MPEPTRERPGEGPEIATRTLAEIYAGQGLHDRALEIYRRLGRRDPGDASVAARIVELERAAAAGEGAAGPAPPVAAAGPPRVATEPGSEPARAAAPPPVAEAPPDPVPAPPPPAAPAAADDAAFLA